mmetsp:Transcript_36760/g.41908  ORF Transcript_36760/g.41908 Transcript_36760/m.41908 type:complete len:137 (-) Transcript_36760:164-574(-)|eukprot:CAMPEP_0194155172 /NCGR_PEP_ID=MMETSP0152-20130528/63458_1 /TAXON_ID=1049557 /ORGANISM="Thalassiothrix antarctica, Strain L6-D1" /LENGTH=136 /DNA_ID=CAMNT_0038861805 /DNA_START=56 /DNA_END=466 /DNA_ORIENTATION=+
MSSILALALCLPLGAGVSKISEEQNWFRTIDSDSIGAYLMKRIHGYAVITWIGFGAFLYTLYKTGAGIAAVDPLADDSNSHRESILLGGLSGFLLGFGLYGSALNYQEIRGGDITIQNRNMTLQLINENESTEEIA